jgi:excisionase family DNA binding protein
MNVTNTEKKLLVDRLSVSPQEAATLIGIGRTKFFAALRDKELASLRIGKRRLIRVAELERWLKAQESK